MKLPSGKDILDGTAGILSHSGTAIALEFGDDALRYIGLAKALPGINLAANTATAYSLASSMSDPNLSTERKMYRTVSTGVPLGLGTYSMLAPYLGYAAPGYGQAAAIIGTVGYLGELGYDHIIVPIAEFGAQLDANFNTWFINGGCKSMYSDENLKKCIAPIDSSLNKLLELNGYSYAWRECVSSKDGNDIGLLAQEVENIFPELITTDSAGFKKVYYYKLIPILIEATKEQQRIITSQDMVLNDYQEKLEKTEKLLESMLMRLSELEKNNK